MKIKLLTFAAIVIYGLCFQGIAMEEDYSDPTERSSEINHLAEQLETLSLEDLEIKAAQGNDEALLQLSYRYFRGEDVAEDAQQGLKFLKLAAEHGNCEALYTLTILNMSNASGNVVDDESFENYIKAADKGHCGSLFALARIYEEDDFGQKKDLKTSVNFYQRAALLNDEFSLFSVAERYDHTARIETVLPFDCAKAGQYYLLANEIQGEFKEESEEAYKKLYEKP